MTVSNINWGLFWRERDWPPSAESGPFWKSLETWLSNVYPLQQTRWIVELKKADVSKWGGIWIASLSYRNHVTGEVEELDTAASPLAHQAMELLDIKVSDRAAELQSYIINKVGEEAISTRTPLTDALYVGDSEGNAVLVSEVTGTPDFIIPPPFVEAPRSPDPEDLRKESIAEPTFECCVAPATETFDDISVPVQGSGDFFSQLDLDNLIEDSPGQTFIPPPEIPSPKSPSEISDRKVAGGATQNTPMLVFIGIIVAVLLFFWD